MESPDFRENLKLLCSYEPSIAEACRRIPVNRQQFNKYLAGTVSPSRRNLRRICDHFGVSEAEILLPNFRFAEIISLKPRSFAAAASLTPEMRAVTGLQVQSQSIPDRYLGYYFRYFYSFAFPGYITKSLVAMFRANGTVYWKNIEILRRRDRGERTRTTFKYVGLVTLIFDRLYVFEQEQILRNSVTQTILYPSYTSRVGQLMGVQTATSNLSGRQPAASIVMLEFLGTKIDLRRALAACGNFPEGSGEIDPEIKARISNRIDKGAKVLSVPMDGSSR
jgi:hypothetical protein